MDPLKTREILETLAIECLTRRGLSLSEACEVLGASSTDYVIVAGGRVAAVHTELVAVGDDGETIVTKE